ncbi:MAG TPA: hypothetical protein VFF89_05295 [Sphingobium sp.]|nr:hypothetical protein [Sphingobium sp.]
MVKITGFDKLQKTLDDAPRAFKELDGTITEVRFDPDDQASIDEAIRSMETAIDRKLSAYRSNPMMAQLIPQMKAKYRDGILARAESARSGTD